MTHMIKSWRILFQFLVYMLIFVSSISCTMQYSITDLNTSDADAEKDSGAPQSPSLQPGTFSISGVQGPADFVTDLYLQYVNMGDQFPTVFWTTSANAVEYVVSIYESDGITEKCPRQTTTTLNYNFSLCPLTAGQSYTLKVIASSGGISPLTETQSQLFYVNRAPSTIADLATISQDSTNNVIDVLLNDTDLDGQILTIISVGTPSHGTASIVANAIHYSPTNGYFGSDSFSYTVQDSTGASKTQTVTITIPSSASPYFADTALSLKHGRVWKFAATGGVPPYTYSITGDGQINSSTGIYTATSTGGSSVIVTVTDSASASSTANVTVSAIPSHTFCNPTSYLYFVGLYGIIHDPGGASGDYANDESCDAEMFWDSTIELKVDANPDFGDASDEYYIDEWSGPNYLYLQGTTPATTTFNSGHSSMYFWSDSAITGPGGNFIWYPSPAVPLTLYSNSLMMTTAETRTLDVINGVGPFIFQIQSGIGTLTAAPQEDQIIFSSNTPGVTVVKVTDSIGTISTLSMTVLPSGPAVASLTGCYSGYGYETNLDVSVGGAGVTNYLYKVVQSFEDCQTSSGYSLAQSTATVISDSVASYYDGTELKLCVVAQDALAGTQAFSSASSCSWIKDTKKIPQIYFSDSGRIINEADQSITFTIQASNIPVKPIVINYELFGPLVTEQSLTGGQATIAAGSTQTTFTVNLTNNPAADVDKILIATITSWTDPFKLATQQSSSVLIKDAQRITTASVKDISTRGNYNSQCSILTNGILKCTGYNGAVSSSVIDTELTFVQRHANTNFSSFEGFYYVLNAIGELFAWGWGFDGNLGQNNGSDLANPTLVSGYTWKQISKSGNVICGIDTSDDLYCWGDGTYSNGVVGNGTTTDSRLPNKPDPSVKYKLVNLAAHSVACAITMDDDLKCWGLNNEHQMGIPISGNILSPMIVDAGQKYKAVGSYGASVCGLTLAGHVRCWGTSFFYDSSVPSTKYWETPTTLDATRSYKKIFVSYSAACMIGTDDKLYCLGKNLPFPTVISSSTGILVDSTDTYSDYKYVSNIGVSGCGLTSLGKIKCWGDTSKPTFYSPSSLPFQLDNETYVKITSQSSGQICGILASGYAKCMGLGSGVTFSEYSHGSSNFTSSALFIDHPSTVNWKSLGTNCGIDSNDYAYCWQGAEYLFSDTFSGSRRGPVLQSTLKFKKIIDRHFSLDYYLCGILLDDSIRCWGRNNYGSAGTGNTTPVKVLNNPDPGQTYLAISTGRYFTCGVTSGNKLKCWGDNTDGNLATGNITTSLTPIVADASTDYSDVQVSTTSRWACGLTTIGKIKCWGKNTSGIGDGTTQSLVPVTIAAAETFSKVTVGLYHACGLRIDGKLMCWGKNDYGQLGMGNTSSLATATLVPGAEVYTLVSAAINTTLAQTTTNTVKITGAMTEAYSFVTIPGGPFVQITGNSTALGLKSNGQLSWTGDPSGVPGTNLISNFLEPILGLVDR